MRKMTLAAFALGGVLTLASCGGGSTSFYDATGTWNGSVTNVNNNNKVLKQQLILKDNAGAISGTWNAVLSDGTIGQLGTISGTRKSDNSAVLALTMTVEGLSGTAVFTGNFSGNTFTGNYTASGGGGGPFSFSR